MQYMGGKYRQSRAIADYVRSVSEGGFVYAEPFCGSLSSASRVVGELRPSTVLLNDVNRPLTLLIRRCLEEGTGFLPTDPEEIRDKWQGYKDRMDMEDPLTAWYGIACSYGGMWFRSPALTRSDGRVYAEECRNSLDRKLRRMRDADVRVTCGDYRDMVIPDGATVYLDPPYSENTRGYAVDSFDRGAFWDYARSLSKRCQVVTSTFEVPDGFRVVHTFGDTISLANRFGKKHESTDEYLVVYDAD